MTRREPGRRERKRAEARRQLYEVALRLFRTRGYEATTVQDIANAADVAKGTFFAYFPTKEHVLLAYHQEMGRHVTGAVWERKFASAERAVQAALRECAAWVAEDRAMARIITRVFFGSDLLRESDERNEARLTEWLERQLAAGRRRGELKRNLDVPLFISLIMGTLSSTVTEWVSAPRAFDLERRVAKKVQFLFDAARVLPASGDPRSPAR